MSECGPTGVPGWMPQWVFCPRERILSVVVEWIVSGFVAGGNAFAGAIGSVFDALGLAGKSAGNGLLSSFSAVGQALLGVAFGVNNAILDIASSAGPVAPLVVVGLFAAIALVLVGALVGVKKVIGWIL